MLRGMVRSPCTNSRRYSASECGSFRRGRSRWHSPLDALSAPPRTVRHRSTFCATGRCSPTSGSRPSSVSPRATPAVRRSSATSNASRGGELLAGELSVRVDEDSVLVVGYEHVDRGTKQAGGGVVGRAVHVHPQGRAVPLGLGVLRF